MSIQDLIDDVALAEVVQTTRGRTITWRVRRLSPTEAMRAGVGLQALLSLAAPPSRLPDEEFGDDDQLKEALEAARRAAVAEQSGTLMTELAAWAELAAMASVQAVRFDEGGEWVDCRLVPAGQEDADKGLVPIYVVDHLALRSIAKFASSGAMEAKERIRPFRRRPAGDDAAPRQGGAPVQPDAE